MEIFVAGKDLELAQDEINFIKSVVENEVAKLSGMCTRVGNMGARNGSSMSYIAWQVKFLFF